MFAVLLDRVHNFPCAKFKDHADVFYEPCFPFVLLV